MTQIGTELHDHIGELVQIWACPEVLHCFVFEHADLFRGEPVHFDHFQGLTVKFEWERKFL